MEHNISEIRNLFSSWESDLAGKSGEWETDFPSWHLVYDAMTRLTKSFDPNELSIRETEDIIFLLARDNESEMVAELLFQNEPYSEYLKEFILKSPENDAKWQYAKWLGIKGKPESEPALIQLLQDTNEYVRRISLEALSRTGSDRIEEFVRIAWNSGDLYQRIMVLSLLKDIGSIDHEKYIQEAREDGRDYILKSLSRFGLEGMDSQRND